MSRVSPPPGRFDAEVEVLVIGAGACGLIAALRAAEAGAEVLVLERDASPAGSTSMSSGFVPAPGTRAQRALGIEDDAELFVQDIQAKAKGLAEPALARMAAERIGPALDWLEAAHGLEWEVLDGFLYPGHSRHRMHAVPERTGAGLLARLLGAVEAAGIPVATGARVETLFAEADGTVRGARAARADGGRETIGCRSMILACCGFGADAARVARLIPAMAEAPYYGHAGNTGDALDWGEALGADARCLSGAQGHGSLAHPHGILVTWALMGEGAVQVNREGRRFHDESQGYSEAAGPVLAQPGGEAWVVLDAARLGFARGFPDFRQAEAAGAVIRADSVEMLAERARLPAAALEATLAQAAAAAEGRGADPFGRDFGGKAPLTAPFAAVRVRGALFHTQGGLMIDARAAVLRRDGSALPDLFAGGGAACGVSGPDPSGYLSGNGLLTAAAFGFVAGASAARTAQG